MPNEELLRVTETGSLGVKADQSEGFGLETAWPM